MTAGDAFPPDALQATDTAGAALIDALIARRRAELARTALAARTAAQRRDQAESALRDLDGTEPGGMPPDLLGVVDNMLEKAVAASELAIASAEREASFEIDRAVSDAYEVLRRAGLDPAAVHLAPRGVLPSRPLVEPPTAAELWRDRGRSATPAPAASSAPPVFPPSAAEAPGPAAGGTTLLLDEPLTVADSADSGAVYDMFWQEVSGERRVRDRLRRRSSKEGA